MKASLFYVSAIAALASAQASIPTCATSCIKDITTSDGKIGGCKPLDIGCICGSSGLLDSIACCLTESCDEQGQKEAVSYAKQICGSAGITDLPDKVVCKDGDKSSSAAESSSKTAAAAESSVSAPSSASTTPAASSSSGSSSGDAEETGSSSGDEGGAANGLSASIAMVGAVVAAVFAL